MNAKEKFKNKWLKWREAFNGKVPQSVYEQIAYMLIDYLMWKVINEGRGILADEANEVHIINGMLHRRFIDLRYRDSQALQIRKLVDGAPLVGKKSVYSLMSIVRQIQECSHLLTRENICFAEKVTLSTEQINEERNAYIQKKYNEGDSVCSIPSDLHVEIFEARHRTIDELCGVSANRRTAVDRVCSEVIEEIISNISSGTNNVKDYVDKHVAHAGTSESVAHIEMDSSNGISFSDINLARETVCKGFADVGYLLYGTIDFQLVPIIQADQFEAIDQPLVRTQDVDTVRTMWREWEDQINALGKRL